MPDREKVVKALECLKAGSYCECCDYKPYDDCIKRVATDALALLKEQQQQIWEFQDQVEYLTDKQKEQKFFVDESGKITPLPVVVRCEDCKHRGDRNKCIVAFVAEKQEMPYFFYDNRGEWFCADGKRKEVK